jgi:hypothetical protein
MSKQGHQPERFAKFIELKDGSGFTLSGATRVYKYDKYGGWFDEYGNYYDQDGNAEDPHSDAPYSDDERSPPRSDDDEDEYEKEFGRPVDYEEDEQDLAHVRILEKVATNMQALNAYPSSGAFRVHFRNLSFYSKREDVFNWARSKVPGVVNLVFFNNERGQFNSKGYFVVENLLAGEQLLRLEGERLSDREINFQLEDVEEFLLSPLQASEQVCDFGAKKYLKKEEPAVVKAPVFMPPPVEKKVAVKPAKVEEKPLPAKQEEKKQEKKEEKKDDLNEFHSYTFLKKAFPKKSSFKEWLTSHGIAAEDYNAVEKIAGNEDYAKIVMKKKIYQALNNTNFNGEKIVFRP